MRKYKIGVLGLRMGHRWARAARDSDKTELTVVNVAKKLDFTRISVLVSRYRFTGENTILR